MVDESGESTQQDDVTGVGRQSELDRLGRGWLCEISRELVPETRWSVTRGTISSWRGLTLVQEKKYVFKYATDTCTSKFYGRSPFLLRLPVLRIVKPQPLSIASVLSSFFVRTLTSAMTSRIVAHCRYVCCYFIGLKPASFCGILIFFMRKIPKFHIVS